MLATIRTLSEETRETVHAGVKRVAEHVAQNAIGDMLGAKAGNTMTSPVMGAADFSYVLQRAPGLFKLSKCAATS